MFCKRMAIIHRKGRDRLEDLREAHRPESSDFWRCSATCWPRPGRHRARVAGRHRWCRWRRGRRPRRRRVRYRPAGRRCRRQGGGSRCGRRPGRRGRGGGGADRAGGAQGAGVRRRPGAQTDGRAPGGGGLPRNNYLPLLEAFYRSHRAVLFTLVDAIELEATSAERGVLDAIEFIRAVRHRRGEWIEEACVVNRGNEQVLGLYRHQRLRLGDVETDAGGTNADPGCWSAAPGTCARLPPGRRTAIRGPRRGRADSYANLHAQMMTWEECEAEVADFLRAGRIPADAKTLVAFCKEKLTETAAAVDAGYPANLKV